MKSCMEGPSCFPPNSTLSPGVGFIAQCDDFDGVIYSKAVDIFMRPRSLVNPST